MSPVLYELHERSPSLKLYGLNVAALGKPFLCLHFVQSMSPPCSIFCPVHLILLVLQCQRCSATPPPPQRPPGYQHRIFFDYSFIVYAPSLPPPPSFCFFSVFSSLPHVLPSFLLLCHPRDRISLCMSSSRGTHLRRFRLAWNLRQSSLHELWSSESHQVRK